MILVRDQRLEGGKLHEKYMTASQKKIRKSTYDSLYIARKCFLQRILKKIFGDHFREYKSKKF